MGFYRFTLAPARPSGPVGEHSGQKTPNPREHDHSDDEAPTTPLDEPSPVPVREPPPGDRDRPPMTV